MLGENGQTPPRAVHAGQQAGGMHPTGMQSGLYHKTSTELESLQFTFLTDFNKAESFMIYLSFTF